MRLSWHGLTTVVGLELRQRVRSRRWIVALVLWFLAIGAVTALIIASTTRIPNSPEFTPGPLAFGLITFFVLGMSLVIAPTFTATSINGDRNAGTLALLQATRLSALEIASGKLVAAWLTSAAFLVVALPFLIWSMVLGNISPWQVLVCFAVMFLLIAVVCAVGLGFSAISSRTAGSTVLTYLLVVALTIVSPIVMGLSVVLTQSRDTVRVWATTPAAEAEYQRQMEQYFQTHPDAKDFTDMPPPPLGQCEWTEVTELRPHPERVWWLVAANPFVVVADAAPLPPDAAADLGSYASRAADPLAALRLGVRMMAQPISTERDECSRMFAMGPGYNVRYDEQGNVLGVTTADGTPVPYESPVKRRPVTADTPIWPWGLGFNLVLGAAFFAVAVRRLRVPYGVLPKGTRVA